MSDPWEMTAHVEQAIDLSEVQRALAVLLDSDEFHELRGLPSGKAFNVQAGAYQSVCDGTTALASGTGIYWTLNPHRRDLQGNARDRDILYRRWLLVDIDPVRPADTSSTDSEKEEAGKIASKVDEHLCSLGWPPPILIDSGNGWHLLYRVDLPNDPLARQLIAGVLKYLASRFNSTTVTIDRSVHNASRISKLPGTWSRKGQNTPDRPHRMARLIHVPVFLRPVETEFIHNLVIPASEPPATVPLDPWVIIASRVRMDASGYLRRALDNECIAVKTAQPGNRNNTLIKAAFNLGQLVGAGLDRGQVEAGLLEMARQCDLPEDEARDVIIRGVAAGMEKPRAIPEAANGRAQAKTAEVVDSGRRIIILASEITPRRVEWLWPDRIPVGKLTTFAGWGGLGKSFVTMDLAARISKGDEIPGMLGECFEPGPVLILNTEDDPDDTSVPRLIEAGGKLDRIAFLKSEILGQFTLNDLKVLDAAYTQLGGARMLVIDPATAHLGGANDHKNSELRALLTPLQLWAAARRVAVILVTHVNKPQAGKVEAMARVVGGVAWVNAVRAAVMFARDPEQLDLRLFIPFKSNNSPERKGLSYHVSPTETLARIEWLGEVDTTADQALNKTLIRPRRIVASEWLIERFRESTTWMSGDLFRAAREAGVSKNAIFEAKEELCLPKARKITSQSGDEAWQWWVPVNWPALKDVGTVGTVGTVDQETF
jgi:hypothetical protein